MLAAAAALLVQALPVEARINPSLGAAGNETRYGVAADLSAPARNRSDAVRLRRPCQRIAANVPMLFIGVGW
jgi:hypothetical protein